MAWYFRPISEFQEHKDVWDHLNIQCFNTPLLNSSFIAPLLEYFTKGNEILAFDGDIGDPDAMSILTTPKFTVWETFQPSQAPLGLWLQRKDCSTDALLAGLRESLPFPVLLLGITQQDPDLLARPEQKKNLKTLDYIQTARVTVSGGFDDYWSRRGKNLRQNLNRQRNRLAREGVQTELKIITAPDRIPEAVVAYGCLESAGWKNAEGTAVHIDNPQGKFYCDMLMNFCRRKDGLIFQYYYGDKLVATDLCIKDDHSLIILKTTYDESITTTSPAMLMRQEAFEYIFNTHLVEKIEFYGKIMDWHTKWSNEYRFLYHINRYALNFW